MGLDWAPFRKLLLRNLKQTKLCRQAFMAFWFPPHEGNTMKLKCLLIDEWSFCFVQCIFVVLLRCASLGLKWFMLSFAGKGIWWHGSLFSEWRLSKWVHLRPNKQKDLNNSINFRSKTFCVTWSCKFYHRWDRRMQKHLYTFIYIHCISMVLELDGSYHPWLSSTSLIFDLYVYI